MPEEITYCQSCSSKFDAFSKAEKFCMDCSEKRHIRRSKLHTQRQTQRKRLERDLGTLLPLEPVKNWEELLLEDLANPFIDLTEIELCQKYGVRVLDFYAFKVNMGLDVFAKTVLARSEKYKDQELLYFRKMLVKQAKTQPNATLIGLQLTGQYNKKLMESDPLSGMSEDSKQKELELLLAKLRQVV